MSNKKQMDKKKFLVVLVVGLFALAVTNAAVLTFFGQVTQEVNVNEAISFTGENAANVEIPGGQSVTSNDLSIESLTSVVVPLSIETTVNPDAPITSIIQFLLSVTGTQGTEERVTVLGSDVGVETLGELDSISWNANAVSGYTPHVDVIIDTNGDGVGDDALVFEYAKVNPSLGCDDSEKYPTGDGIGTFGDKGIVDNTAKAWLSSGDAGPCSGSSTFFWHTLAEWKAGQTNQNGKNIDGNTKVLRFEFEVDNWIEDSSAEVSSILIDEQSVKVSLKPLDSLDFNVETTFGIDTSEGTYTLTTTVAPRI